MKPFINHTTGDLTTRPDWADARISFRDWEKSLVPADVLAKLPLKVVDIELAKRGLEIFGIRDGLGAIAISELVFPEFLANRFEITSNVINEDFSAKLLQKVLSTIESGFAPLVLRAPCIKEPQVVWTGSRGNTVLASLFDATFAVVDAKYACLPKSMEIEEGSKLLIMNIPKADRDALRFHSNPHLLDLDFLPDGGAAVLVFRPYQDGFEMEGLHSPLIAGCRNRSLAAKYQDWRTVLCAAFHYVVAQHSILCPSKSSLAAVLCLQTSQNRYGGGTGFFALGDGDSPHRVTAEPTVAERHILTESAVSRMRARLDEDGNRADPTSVHNALAQSQRLKPLKDLMQYLSPTPPSEVKEWRRLFREYASLDLFLMDKTIPPEIGADRTFCKDAPFETAPANGCLIHAPIEPLGRRSLPRVSEEAWSVHAKELKNPRYADILKTIGPEFAPISKGVEAGARSDWWTMEQERRVDLMHLADQKRHPALRFSMPDGDKWSSLVVGIKGGGLRSLNDPAVAPLRGELRSPAYLKRKSSEGELVLTTHHLWGGMQLWEAEGEFTTTLMFQAFLRRHRPEGRLPMATPIDVGALHHVPLWSGERVSWDSPIEFIRDRVQYSSNSKSALAVFRTVGVTEVRMLQLVDKIFLHDRPKDATRGALQEQIVSALRYFYAIHGESLVVPDAQLGQPGEAISPREVLKFLHDVYSSNRSAAKRIRTQVAEPLLWAHGVMHRLGGDLGGLHIQKGVHQFGAFGGGPAALRNLTIAGEMRDIDTQIRVPGLKNPGMPEVGMYQMEKVRRQGDLIILADSLYWLDKILFGARRGDPATPREITSLGKINSVVRFGSDDRYLDELELNINRFDPHTIQLDGRDISAKELLKERDLEVYRREAG